jgi:hypothetical protein
LWCHAALYPNKRTHILLTLTRHSGAREMNGREPDAALELSANHLALPRFSCKPRLIGSVDPPGLPDNASRGRHFRAAWLRLKQTDLIPGKGQFR